MMIWYLNLTPREIWVYAQQTFTPEECEAIIDLGKKNGLNDGKVSNENQPDFETRKSKVSFFDPKNKSFEWIYRRATDVVNGINKQFWNYDLSHIESLQFTSYTQKDDFYGKHTDQPKNHANFRKLSFSIQLSDPDTYVGSDLRLYESANHIDTRRDRGTTVFFPSFVLHEVTPLLSGERYSLVGWVCGPPFK